jgi:hypothetical protein
MTDPGGADRPDAPGRWWGSVSRVTHEMFLSPPWLASRAGELDADRYAEALAAAGIEAVEIYFKDHNGVCYYPSANGPGFERDLVGPWIEALHARAIRVLGYISAGYDAFALARHPEWKVVDREGNPRLVAPPLEMVCLRSPYREYLLRQVEDLVAVYPVDGLWLDIIPLAWPGPHTDNPPADVQDADFFMVHDVPLPCACATCRREFAEAYGRPIPTHPDEADLRDLFDFYVGGMRRLLLDARALVRRHRPAALFTYNGSGCPGDPIDVGDIVSIEAHAPNHRFQSFVARWARGRGRPIEVMTPGGLEGWFTPQAKPPSLLELEVKIADMHAATSIIGRPVARDGSWDQAALDDIAAAHEAVRDPERPKSALEPWSEVLVASTIRPATAPALWSPAMAGLEFWHDVLLQQHVQYDIGGLDRDLSRYGLVVLADQRAMSDEEAERVRAYVRAGGAILVTGETGRYDERGARRASFALADCLGVEPAGRSGLPYAYVSTGAALGDALARRQLIVKREPLRVAVTAGEVVGWVHPPGLGSIDPYIPAWGYAEVDRESPALPFVVLNDVGRGRSAYVAAALDDGPRTPGRAGTAAFEAVWIRELAATLVRRLLGTPALTTDAPPSLEVVLNRSGRELVVDLVDHASVTPTWIVPEPEATGHRNVRLRLDRSRLGPLATATVAGRPCDVRVDGDWLEIDVPPFAIHARVVVDGGIA